MTIGKSRTIGCFILALVLFCMAVPMRSEAGALSAEDAKVAISEHIARELRYQKEAYDFANLVYNEGKWAFSAILKEYPSTQDGLIVGSMDAQGKLLSIRGPEDISLDQQIMISLKKCFRDPQGIEKMYAFKQEWEPVIQAMLNSGMALADIPVYENYLGVILMDIALPTEADITKEEALQKAKEALAACDGWTMEKVDMYIIVIEVYYTPSEIGRPIYQFLFNKGSRLEKRFDGAVGERAYEKYEKELIAAFGGDISVPVYASVMIDAQTGDLVEEIKIECPPVKSHYLDYILR